MFVDFYQLKKSSERNILYSQSKHTFDTIQTLGGIPQAALSLSVNGKRLYKSLREEMNMEKDVYTRRGG